MKSCGKCKYQVKNSLMWPSRMFDLCSNPNVRRRIGNKFNFCDLLRDDRFSSIAGQCGQEARFFERDNRWFWQKWFK